MAWPFGREHYSANVIFHISSVKNGARVVTEMDADMGAVSYDNSVQCAVAIERLVRLAMKGTPEERAALAAQLDAIEARVLNAIEVRDDAETGKER